MLVDSAIQQTIGADQIARPYSGAVCQYVLARGLGPDVGAATPAVMIDVTFAWYETGSLDRERSLAITSPPFSIFQERTMETTVLRTGLTPI